MNEFPLTVSGMEVFFGKLPAQNVLWFQALEYGDETSTQVVRDL